MSGNRRVEVTKATRAVAALALAVVLVAATTIGIRASYGFFNNEMVITFMLPRAGQALHEGSFVEYRGVEVGKVHSIELRDNQVRVVARLHNSVKVPKNVSATIEPLTFFGDKFIDLADTDGSGGPFLADGSTVTDTGLGDEVETLVAKLVPVLSGIDTVKLTTVLTEFEKTVRNGEGERIAASFDEGVKMAALFRNTLDAQLTALASFNRFSAAVKDYGPVLNQLSSTFNEALPVFNDARQKFETLLDTLGPFADNLASLLSVNRPDIDRILNEGGNIVRVVTAHQQDLADTIYGLSRYLYAFASGISADVLPNGKRGAYFKIFVDAGNLTDLICGLVANAPAQLASLRQALFGQSGLIDCSKNVYTAPGANAAPAPAASSTGAGSAPAGGASPSATSPSATSPGATSPGQQLSDDVYGQLAQPDQATSSDLTTVLSTLLEGLS